MYAMISFFVDPTKMNSSSFECLLPRKEGIKKILIIYVGITCNTNLIRTSLPALDSVFPLQEFIFFHTRSLMILNIDVLLLPIIDDSPKHLQVPRAIFTSNMAAWKTLTKECLQGVYGDIK